MCNFNRKVPLGLVVAFPSLVKIRVVLLSLGSPMLLYTSSRIRLISLPVSSNARNFRPSTSIMMNLSSTLFTQLTIAGVVSGEEFVLALHFEAMCSKQLHLKHFGLLSASVQFLASCSDDSQLKQCFLSGNLLFVLCSFLASFAPVLELSFFIDAFLFCVLSFRRSYTSNFFFSSLIVHASYNKVLLLSSSGNPSTILYQRIFFDVSLLCYFQHSINVLSATFSGLMLASIQLAGLTHYSILF